MDPLLLVRIYENQTLVFSTEVSGPLELGRQRTGEAGPFRQSEPETAGASRVVVARYSETNISRVHALLEPLSEDRVRVTNLSAGLPIGLGEDKALRAGGKVEISLPNHLTLENKVIRLEGPEKQVPDLESLKEPTLVPGQVAPPTGAFSNLAEVAEKSMDAESVIRLLKTALVVLQSAATSKDFFDRAASGVINIAGLDSGAVLLREHGGWRVVAFYTANGSKSEPDWRPSRHVLQSVCDQKRTLRQKPQPTGEEMVSLAEIKAVVAAPILNRQGEILGVLYGDRRSTSDAEQQRTITKIEAMLVELLASGAAAGLARLEQEQIALAARVKFEQFFTPELSRQLELEPKLLEGKDAEVTILFTDIRGFSRISERLGPAKTGDWIRDVMESLSNCVIAHQGVRVDHVGDELMAMWGAPQDQPDHAELACRAGLDMLRQLPRLNEKWQAILDEPVDIGIGVNTGVARVGNVGSEKKFKYGPLGNAVNLAHRTQGATRYLKSKLIATGVTKAKLGSEFEARKLCTVRVKNIGKPVELFELAPIGQAEFSVIAEQYGKALAEFEQGKFEEAARLLGQALSKKPDDGPSLALMSRTVDQLVGEHESFDSVWELPSK
jgi:adenylate cyclase